MQNRFSFAAIVTFIAACTLFGCVFGPLEGDDWDSEREDGGDGVIITAYKGSASGTITLPETLNGKPVIGVEGDSDGTGIFVNNETITGVIIPDSVTFIGDRAFYGNQLTRAAIGNNVTSIGDFAFYGNKLDRLTIGNSVTSIGIWAFSGNLLASVTIPESVTFIGTGAFSGNELISVRIGADVSLSSNSNSFPSGFDAYYDNNGKKAGLYTRPSGAGSNVWAYSAE